jgi:hypothetical protein
MKYQYVVATEGGTINAADWCEALALNPAAGLTALTVGMPKFPVDGQTFSLNSTQAVTTLTLQVQTGSGQTLLGAATAVTAGLHKEWVYVAPLATWSPA